MKKTALFLAVMLLLSMVVFASCKPSNPSEEPACHHVDRNADLVCDLCQAAVDAIPQPEVPDIGNPDWKPEHTHSFVEGKCECGEEDPNYVPPHEHNFVEGKCECGESDPNYVPACNHVDDDGDYACDSCGEDMMPENLERVNYSLNISTLETGTLAADSINSKFTIVSGSEIRNRTKTYEGVEYQKSVKIGNSTTKIKVDVPGTGKLSFLIQNGSSGAAMQFVTVTAPDGTVYDIEFLGTDGGSPVVKIELDVTAGEWIISRGKNGGTQDIFELSLSCIVEKADENGFELVSEGKVDYLVSDALDLSGLRLNATFANGKTDPLALDSVSIDTSAVNTAVSGTYPVVISYKEYAPITINVNYYAPESIELFFDAVEKLPSNTAAGNGVYYNHSFKELYLVGEEFSNAGLSVWVLGKCGEEMKSFTVTSYVVSGFDSSFADYNIITISAYGISTTIELHIVETQPTPNEDGVYQLLVDPAYEGLAGNISGPYHVFRTIQQALDYAAKIDKAAVKELSIAPGLYEEKLEIEVPNLHIIGLGENPDDVVIEWASLYGLVDAGGFTHTTDSTQTVAIRESATNVTIENITISNYWNSQDRMDAAGLAIERGLALLVQADRFVMKNSKLLGIQDTLELFTGRQYFENVFISGYTDFIFGTNNTTYFKNCTIHVIDTEKDDKGTAGYLTAFKGSNKGDGDAIVYGAIFDGCKFTADEGVSAGKTAIGRTWGAYAAVAVINSELGGHISVDGYNPSNNKNTRYISMNGIHPTDSTVQFVEYNNTGAGAITEAVAGMRFLTAEEAAAYANFAVIFGTTNGKVTYLDPWNPESTEIVVDDRTYYYFNGTEGSSGTSYTYTENIQGSVVEWNGLTIDATKGKLTARGSDSQFNQGAKIIFNVEAGTLVTVISYPGYGYYTINGIAHNANDTFSVYFANATEVVVESTSTSYIYSIIINPNEEAPAAPTLNEIKVEGLKKDYTVGDELNLADVVVKAYYSDYSVVTVEATVDATAVNNAAAGEYDVVFTYGGKTVTVKVTFEGADADPRKDLNITFGSNGNYNEYLDMSDASIRDNGGDNTQVSSGSFSIVVYQGATVSIHGYPSYTSYSINGGDSITDEYYTYVVTEDGTLVIEATNSNNYFYSIDITYPVVAAPESFEVTFGSEGNYKDAPAVVDLSNVQIGDNGGNNSQVKNGYITIKLFAGAKLTINGYPSYTSYKINDGEEITAETYEYVAAADETVTITPVSGNNYFYSFSVSYPVEVKKESFEITFGSEGNYKDAPAVVDLSNIQIGDNGGNNSQVKNGFITIELLAGAKVTINGYPGYTSYKLNDGEEITAETYEYVAATDETLTITPVSGNNYFYSIKVEYSEGGAEEPDTPVETTHTFDAGVLADCKKEDKADCETEVIDIFTVHYGKNSVVESNVKTFEDEYTSTKRFTLGGKATPGASGKCCVEFTVTEKSTVKIWWVSGGDNRLMTIFDANGNKLVAGEASVKNALYIDSFTVEAGTYFIGGDSGSNYIYKIEVETTK